jgi:hypothetical protein
MAWDSKASRRRQNSNASARSAHPAVQTIPVEIFTPKSSHVADPALQPFLAPSFDPADFFNTTLPHLQTPSSSQHARSQEVPLAELSTQTQTLLSNLSTHTTRLTTTLTQLTDEILRSGSRLAYEVEVLRGETVGLSEALTEGLQDDIAKFVPDGLDQHLVARKHSTIGARARSSTITPVPKTPPVEDSIVENTDPQYVNQLRTLTSVRGRLETVIKTFGDAMSWTFPPSEVSVSSSFLSVSAPEPGSEAHSVEEKGQQVSKKLREEIADLLVTSGDPGDGIESAAKRVEELKELVKVWKGTAEEKARVKFVEGLAKIVEDSHRELLRDSEKDGRSNATSLSREVSRSLEGTASDEGKPQTGYGFINQLQKMRGGL